MVEKYFTPKMIYISLLRHIIFFFKLLSWWECEGETEGEVEGEKA